MNKNKFNKKYSFFSYILTLITVTSLIYCSPSYKLQSFKSDGCSMFPDKSLIDSTTWCECCFEHDIAYWHGGTREERKSADLKFKNCILKKTNDQRLAELMYNGVRLGGSPYFPTLYRWGYGWTYSRGYKPLSPEEKKLVDKLLEEYFKKEKSSKNDSLKLKHPCK